MNAICRGIEFIQRRRRGKRIETEPSPYAPWKMPDWLIVAICLVGSVLLANIAMGSLNLVAHLRGETVYPIVAFDWWWMWIFHL